MQLMREGLSVFLILFIVFFYVEPVDGQEEGGGAVLREEVPVQDGEGEVGEVREEGGEKPLHMPREPGKVKVVGLEECLKMSRKNHPAIVAARHKLVSMKRQLDEARWAPFFNIGMNTLVAPTSRIQAKNGNWLDTGTDIGEYDELGIWVRLDFQAGFPLFTFGKIKSYRQMAKEGVNIAASEVRKQTNEIDFEVRRAYYTVVFARQMRAVLSEGRGYLDQALDLIERSLEAEDGEATVTDQLKVKTYKAQLDAQIIQIENVEKIAMAGLKFLTGVDDIEVADDVLVLEEGSLKSLAFYMDEARKKRPEFSILDSAVNVSLANLKLQKLHFLPDFLLVGSYTYAYANKVDNPPSAFLSDPYNVNAGGVVFMMRYPLDFLPAYYRLGKAKAQLREMEAKREAARGAILLEVEKAYEEARSLYERAQVLRRGKKSAKGWVVAMNQNYQAGIAELRDFTDALVAYFTTTAEYYKAIYDYDLALSSLRLATGSDEIF